MRHNFAARNIDDFSGGTNISIGANNVSQNKSANCVHVRTDVKVRTFAIAKHHRRRGRLRADFVDIALLDVSDSREPGTNKIGAVYIAIAVKISGYRHAKFLILTESENARVETKFPASLL